MCIRDRFLKGAGKAALEEDRLVDTAQFFEQLEVLHIPGAYLYHICLLYTSIKVGEKSPQRGDRKDRTEKKRLSH